MIFHNAIFNDVKLLNADNQAKKNELIKKLCIIKKNLEYMLNTRKTVLQWPGHYHHINQSLLCFGLSDYKQNNINSNTAKNQLCREIQKLITLHEPNLKNIKVQIIDQTTDDFYLHIHIEATYFYQSLHQSVTLESIIDPLSQNFKFA